MADMKKNILLTTLAAISVTLASGLAESSALAGTDILHLMVRESMTNSGVIPDATGRVDAKLVRQGHAFNQKLDLKLEHLATNATYHLSALIGDDTNFTNVVEFTTDDQGAAQLHYRRLGADGNHGLGHGKIALPTALSPLSDLRELDVVDGNAQTVLSADLTAPDKLHYLVKRSLTNDGSETNAAAALRIHSTTNSTQFRLLASGLEPAANYSVVVNGGIDQTAAADADGRLRYLSRLA